ncbi:MAG: TRAP transporter small permease [Burkholderiales bacterium]|nr:TRAP transporter small permease [Burkholderiales bacterium]
MTPLLRLNAALSAAVLVLARLCLACLGAVVLYGVVLRYAFNDAPPYVEQVALLLVISVAMFGAASVAHDAGHIGLESLVRRLPPRVQEACTRLVALLTLAFALVLVWGSLQMALSTHADRIPTLGISEAWRYAPPLIAGVLIALFSLGRVLRPAALLQH